jgi:C4-dicarboxylate-specific signal transduction histidine kinase
VGNALDAMAQAPRPEGHQLRVQAAKTPEGTLLTVADTGPGFDPTHKDKAQDPFFTTKDTGTGLGLAIVKNILESHGATLTLDNAAGGGAKVEMLFPGH